ncbi:MAG: NYN domain-containing protein [Candidatus Roizmanbacteria bacterium]|nr:NYN domain-containing protein [Candidatus Roizmanbacteria bacterium]
MSSHNSNRVAVFIDASNLWQAQKVKGRMFDFQKLQNYLLNEYGAVSIQCYYYTAYPADGTRTYGTDGKHKFFTYLKKALKFVVRKKELKRISVETDEGTMIQEKGNMDVEMTIDAIHFKDKYDVVLFFTGDSDFLALISYLRNGGKKVYVYSSKNNVSSELRTGTDGYTDVLDITADIWGMTLKHREQK